MWFGHAIKVLQPLAEQLLGEVVERFAPHLPLMVARKRVEGDGQPFLAHIGDCFLGGRQALMLVGGTMKPCADAVNQPQVTLNSSNIFRILMGIGFYLG